MGVRLLLLSPLQKGSGNYATISRIRFGLEKNGITCLLANSSDFITSLDLAGYIEAHHIDIALGIHALKSGQLLTDVSCPYIIILGGTDVNGDTFNLETFRKMTVAVQNARKIVAFSKAVHDRFQEFWPDLGRERIVFIPQGVAVRPSEFCIKTYIQDQCRNCQESSRTTSHPVMKDVAEYRKWNLDDIKLFSIVGGIRPVKNPLYIAKSFSEWRSLNKRQNCFLAVIGTILDNNYFEQFYKVISKLSGVIYVPGLSTEDCHAAIQDSTALVNTSNSEGMALAILEAMCLGTPVLARGIPGNLAIVQHRQTGLVFNSEQEFGDQATLVLEQSDLVTSLTHNASKYITQNHSQEVEEQAYMNLVQEVLANNVT